MNKKLILPALLVAVVGAGAVATHTSSVYAFDESQTFAQRFAQRFGVNQDEVEGFMQEMHQEREQQHQARMEENLDEAVTNGVISQEQKQLLIEKMNEMKGMHMEEMQDLTKEERDQLRTQHHEEFQAWAEQNGIDLEQLRPEGFGDEKMMNKGRMHGFDQ